MHPEPLRRCFEVLSRNVRLRRRLATPRGPRSLSVTPAASLRYWLPGSLNSDVPLLDFARHHVRPGDTVWDIGANVGIFSVTAAVLAGSGGCVLAVEPDPFLCHLLRQTSLRLPAQDAPLRILCAAAAHHTGIENFCLTQRSRASSHLASSHGSSQTGGIRTSFDCPAFTLDDLARRFPPPDVLKIDVEGAEGDVLDGAVELLRSRRPVICIEVDGINNERVTARLHGAGYRLHNGGVPGTPPVARAAWNTIALPPHG